MVFAYMCDSNAIPNMTKQSAMLWVLWCLHTVAAAATCRFNVMVHQSKQG